MNTPKLRGVSCSDYMAASDAVTRDVEGLLLLRVAVSVKTSGKRGVVRATPADGTTPGTFDVAIVVRDSDIIDTHHVDATGRGAFTAADHFVALVGPGNAARAVCAARKAVAS